MKHIDDFTSLNYLKGAKPELFAALDNLPETAPGRLLRAIREGRIDGDRYQLSDPDDPELVGCIWGHLAASGTENRNRAVEFKKEIIGDEAPYSNLERFVLTTVSRGDTAENSEYLATIADWTIEYLRERESDSYDGDDAELEQQDEEAPDRSWFRRFIDRLTGSRFSV